MTEQIVIQERIDKVMNDEFNRLLRENTNDKLLNLLIEGKIDDYSLEGLIEFLEGEMNDE